jgi:hypothetical protein
MLKRQDIGAILIVQPEEHPLMNQRIAVGLALVVLNDANDD